MTDDEQAGRRVAVGLVGGGAVSDRDEHGYFTDCGGHQWTATRGPDSACHRCRLYYSHWHGDRCPDAPWTVDEISVEVSRLLGRAAAVLAADRAPEPTEHQADLLGEVRRLIGEANRTLTRVTP